MGRRHRRGHSRTGRQVMSREILDTSKKAAAAINVLGGVIGLLEGGVDSGWQKTATQIINI